MGVHSPLRSRPVSSRAATALIGPLPPALFLAADTAYDSDGLRRFLAERGKVPVIPNNPTRKRTHPFNPAAYRQRNAIERMFGRLKDWRRVATRYDKTKESYLGFVTLEQLCGGISAMMIGPVSLLSRHSRAINTALCNYTSVPNTAGSTAAHYTRMVGDRDGQ